MIPKINLINTPASKIVPIQPDGWRLEIPAGEAGKYRLAQLDDYSDLPRLKFPWISPVTFRIQARASSNNIPGTWGFGLWNDPFSVSLGAKGSSRKFPTLPNCAWFFMASPPNHLTIHDDVPGQGKLAGVFQSPRLLGILLAPALAAMPLLLIPAISKILREYASRYIKQESTQFTCDLEMWHEYRIGWGSSGVRFFLDDRLIFQTVAAPIAPLGLVIWIDNQFASWSADGKIRMGTLNNPLTAWVEVKDLHILCDDN